MAIFSRRILQELINKNAALLTKEQLVRQVKSLNASDSHSLATEWEIILIYAFSLFGRVDYESDSGGRKPDLEFLSKDGQVSFLADIATVSDAGLEDENPLEDLQNEFVRRVRKVGLNADNFSWSLSSQQLGSGSNKKIKLKIPKKGSYQEVFNESFRSFIAAIAQAPESQHSFSIKTDSGDVAMAYNPGQEFLLSHYPSYRTPHSLKSNPVINALKAKAAQLKRSNRKGQFGIFLCDGGCHTLMSDGYAKLSYSITEIIQDFLRQNSSINWVVTVCVKQKQILSGPRYIAIKVFTNKSTGIDISLQNILEALPHTLPEPITDPTNALHFLKRIKGKGESFYGGLQMTEKITGSSIKIPARALLELLASNTSLEKFLTDHHQIPTEERPDNRNFFSYQLLKGRTIKNIRLIPTKEDDDWIEIEFGKQDAAISEFVLPEKQEAF